MDALAEKVKYNANKLDNVDRHAHQDMNQKN